MVDPPAAGPPQWLDPTGGCPLWQSSLQVYALPELEVSAVDGQQPRQSLSEGIPVDSVGLLREDPPASDW
jgi:hypothetical protein